jgi:acyl-CoA dehydrogenase
MPTEPDPHHEIREGVRQLCRRFPDEYFRGVDAQRAYPEAFVDALTRAGWLAALIPADYGGPGLSMAQASVIMEEINRSGGNAAACHGQMYVMNSVVLSGSQAQKRHYLPRIAAGGRRSRSSWPARATTARRSERSPGARIRRKFGADRRTLRVERGRLGIAIVLPLDGPG